MLRQQEAPSAITPSGAATCGAVDKRGVEPRRDCLQSSAPDPLDKP